MERMKISTKSYLPTILKEFTFIANIVASNLMKNTIVRTFSKVIFHGPIAINDYSNNNKNLSMMCNESTVALTKS